MLEAGGNELDSQNDVTGSHFITKAHLVEWVAEGLGQREMAERAGCSQTNIRYHLKKFGLKSKGDRRGSVQYDAATVIDLATQCHSMTELCSKLGIRNAGRSYSVFMKWCESVGVDLGRILRRSTPSRRAESEARVLNDASTSVIGGVSHLEVAAQLTRLGFVVFDPVVDGGRIDMAVMDRAGSFRKIQVKTVLKQSAPGEVLIPVLNKTRKGEVRHYAGDVDHVVAYDRRDGRIYAVDPKEFSNAHARLRIKAPKLTVPYVLAENYLLSKAYPCQRELKST